MRTLFDISSPKTWESRKILPPSLERDKAQREIYQEWQARIEKLETIMVLIAQKLIDDNIPIDEYGKIYMKEFIKKTPNDEKLYYSDVVNQDQAEAIARLKQWGIISGLSESLSTQQFEKERLRRLIGEQFEVLVFILLYKFLQENFIVARTSLYDDHINKIDLLLIDKKTGAVICLIISVSDNADKLKKTRENLWKINTNTEKNGVDLKYGLSIENGRLIFKAFHNLPVFYFALKKEEVKKHIDQLVCSLDRTSKYEEDLFKDLMWLLGNQIEKLDEFSQLNTINKTLDAQLEMIKAALGKIAYLL